MAEPEVIVNKVAQSDIKVFNLESLWDGRDVVELDVAGWLFKQLVLKEKDFREHVRGHDWSQYDGKHFTVFCSTDAIIPTWAMMLVASRAQPFATSVSFGRKEDAIRDYFERALDRVDWSDYAGAPVVVKGCASKLVPPSAYVSATVRLQAEASKLMFGEPCSAVPLWRRKSDTQPKAGVGRKPAALPPGLLKNT